MLQIYAVRHLELCQIKALAVLHVLKAKCQRVDFYAIVNGLYGHDIISVRPPGGSRLAVVSHGRGGVSIFEPRIHRRHAAAVEHVTDSGDPAALVEHEAVVVLRVHGERYPVNGVHDVGVGQRPVAAARAARLPDPL